MSLLIKPTLLKGRVTIPPSKSLSHRAIICASLCMEGESRIENLVFSQDIKATIEGMKVLGADIKEGADWTLIKRNKVVSNNIIDCNESGSTLRFLIPLSLVLSNGCTFTGRGKLRERPLDVYYDIFKKANIAYESTEGRLPLRIRGRLPTGSYEIPGNISSQFITGMLFALPLLEGDSQIKIRGPLESKNYLDLTLDMLKKFNIGIEKNDSSFFIRGRQKYKARDYRLEGDYSQAAFFLTANALGSNIQCLGLEGASLQGDKEILNIIEKYSLNPEEVTIDGSQIPDLVPIIAVLASLKEKCTTYIVKAGRLRIKESDRLKAIASEMNKLGAHIEETGDGLIIKGLPGLRGGSRVDSWSDHRIAMALAIAACKCEYPLVLDGYEAVNKSYPQFWDDYKRLGGLVYELNNRK